MKKQVIVINEQTVSINGDIYQKISNPKIVMVAGLIWDTKNLTDELCNFYEANGRAVIAGKRLPTQEEWNNLTKCFHIWDSEQDGMWFADNKCDLRDPYKSLFLPAAGCRGTSGSVSSQGTYGYYWSSSAYSSTYGYYLYFNSSYVNPSVDTSYAIGLGVRCVHL